jgi:hypothetical protein
LGHAEKKRAQGMGIVFMQSAQKTFQIVNVKAHRGKSTGVVLEIHTKDIFKHKGDYPRHESCTFWVSSHTSIGAYVRCPYKKAAHGDGDTVEGHGLFAQRTTEVCGHIGFSVFIFCGGEHTGHGGGFLHRGLLLESYGTW